MTLSVQALVGKAEAALRRESDAKAIRIEVKAREIEARRLEDEADGLRAEIRSALVADGEQGFTTDTLVIERVATPPKVVLDAEVNEKELTWRGVALPVAYVKFGAATLNRALLSAELKAGKSVGFARLEVSETLKIERVAAGTAPEQEF